MSDALTEIYDNDDPMLIALQDSTPVDNPLRAATHCCKLLPAICCFHCRTCFDCFKEMDCLSGCIILLPFLSGVVGVATGLGVGAGVVFRDGYYDCYGWHNARDAALPFAIGSIVFAGILFYFHPKPVYCMRVQRLPPLRLGIACKGCGSLGQREWGSLSANRKQVARRRSGRLMCGRCEMECLPLLVFLPFLSAGLWTMYLFSLSKSLGYIPMCVVALVCGATTKFSRSRCRRLTRVCCGRTTYEIISDVNPVGAYDDSEEDENEWRHTSGSEEAETSSSDESMFDSDEDGDGEGEDEGIKVAYNVESDESSSEDDVAGVTIDADSSQRNVKGNKKLRKRAFEV